LQTAASRIAGSANLTWGLMHTWSAPRRLKLLSFAAPHAVRAYWRGERTEWRLALLGGTTVAVRPRPTVPSDTGS
jgi:hypothetical protein